MILSACGIDRMRVRALLSLSRPIRWKRCLHSPAQMPHLRTCMPSGSGVPALPWDHFKEESRTIPLLCSRYLPLKDGRILLAHAATAVISYGFVSMSGSRRQFISRKACSRCSAQKRRCDRVIPECGLCARYLLDHRFSLSSKNIADAYGIKAWS